MDEHQKKLFTINLANELEARLNTFYDSFSKRGFFCNTHRFRIKGESVAKTGFWVAKKLYALDKVYDLEKNQDTKPNKRLVVKGLAAVRSSFPKKFATFMRKLLEDILQWAPKDQIDIDILELKKSLTKENYVEISRNTTANNLNKYSFIDDVGNIHFKKGAPVHVKAALSYNKLLKHFKLENKFDTIREREKIKYVYLQTNPMRIEAVAYKGYDDPPEILNMIEQYIDLNGLFDKELKNKLQDFYNALSWGKIPTEVNQKSFQFFK